MLGWAILCLVGAAVVGVALRFAFAGLPTPRWLALHAADVRHAHSHLGFYGVVFPALWIATRQRGLWAPGARLAHGYGAVTVLTCVAFAVGGYWLPSIIGSTVVGGVWAVAAWRTRAGMFTGDWRHAAPLAVAVGLALVPLVAVLTRRDLALAQQVVRAFLTLLLLGAALPSLVGAAPIRALLWLPAVCLAAIGGGLELPTLRALGYGLTGALLLLAIWRRPFDGLTTPLWGLTAAGFIAYAAGVLTGHAASVAGVHFIALGPLTITLLYRLRRRPLPSVAWLYLMCVGVMCASIAAMATGLDGARLQRVAAVSGAAVALLLVALVLSGRRAAAGDRRSPGGAGRG